MLDLVDCFAGGDGRNQGKEVLAICQPRRPARFQPAVKAPKRLLRHVLLVRDSESRPPQFRARQTNEPRPIALVELSESTVLT